MKAATHSSSATYRPDIDGLRALAVLAVVGYHAFPGRIPGGFVGVDIFFVISGFLISGNILSGLQDDMAGARFSFLDFYARRARRIFPALALVLASLLIAGWWALLPSDYAALGRHVAAGAGFGSNLLLWSEAGYFDSAAVTKPLLHLWSLGVEEQFYLIWPLILWAAWRVSARWLGAVLASLLLASLTLNIIGIGDDPTATFYSPLTRFWELIAGGALAWSLRQYPGMVRAPLAVRQTVSVAGLSLIVAAIALLGPSNAYPGWWACAPVLGAVMMIAAQPDAAANRWLLASRPAVAIGLISYPLYLWHWPLLAFPHLVRDAILPVPWRIAMVVLALVLAWLTTHFIERPIRQDRRMGVGALIAIMMAIGGAGLAIALTGGVAQRPHLAQYSLKPDVAAQLVGAYWPYSRNAQCEGEFRYPDADRALWWFCMKSSPQPATIILMGNSFANHLYPGMIANPAMRHQSVLSIGTCAVGMVDDPTLNPDHPCYGPRRLRQRAYLRAIIRRTPTIRLAIISPLPEQPTVAQTAGIIDEIRFLQTQGVRVLLIGPHIQPGFDIKQCYGAPFRPAAQSCDVPIHRRATMAAALAPFRAALARSGVNAPLFDPNILLCSDHADRCSFTHGGLPLLRDNGHFSAYGSVRLQSMLNAWAAHNMPDLITDPAPRAALTH